MKTTTEPGMGMKLTMLLCVLGFSSAQQYSWLYFPDCASNCENAAITECSEEDTNTQSCVCDSINNSCVFGDCDADTTNPEDPTVLAYSSWAQAVCIAAPTTTSVAAEPTATPSCDSTLSSCINENGGNQRGQNACFASYTVCTGGSEPTTSAPDVIAAPTTSPSPSAIPTSTPSDSSETPLQASPSSTLSSTSISTKSSTLRTTTSPPSTLNPSAASAALAILQTAVPSSIRTNPTAACFLSSPYTSYYTTPAWYTSLPSNAQSYFSSVNIAANVTGVCTAPQNETGQNSLSPGTKAGIAVGSIAGAGVVVAVLITGSSTAGGGLGAASVPAAPPDPSGLGAAAPNASSWNGVVGSSWNGVVSGGAAAPPPVHHVPPFPIVVGGYGREDNQSGNGGWNAGNMQQARGGSRVIPRKRVGGSGGVSPVENESMLGSTGTGFGVSEMSQQSTGTGNYGSGTGSGVGSFSSELSGSRNESGFGFVGQGGEMAGGSRVEKLSG
ncbi:hypothetical protein G7Y89_g12483 [Cudoniella acicularis]|uniref:Extracellular membrane protein CFEM domain-containing protein n=1 Tax=Cudoniella acicularis TaxID=354080 RepID=A0A8H4VZL5_9HELO|nr:hypothetical protein G7Y89_g12483 [Cudoniella acicularis]